MPVCTFFGHRDCHGLQEDRLRQAIEALIGQGVTEFTVGHQGQFDGMVRRCLHSLREKHPHIQYRVVLAYLPVEQNAFGDNVDTVYPEGLETVPPRFAIQRRNDYLVETADICLCYINHTWGGAYRSVCKAKRRGLRVINLGTAELAE